MSNTSQAASRITEDQILNYLVSQLDRTFDLSLGDNAEVDAADIFDIIVGSCADQTSVSALCTDSSDAPHPNTVLRHLRTKLDLETVETRGNSLLRTDVLETLPEAVEVVVDLHLRPYYGDEAETAGLYHSQAKAGTTAFHAYGTLYARVRDKRYTLAVRPVTDGETASDLLAEFCGLLDSFAFDVKAVYLDREFYDSKCLTLLQAHNYAYVMPIVKWGKTIKQELSTGWSRQLTHSLQARVAGHEWTVEFPIYIDCTYHRGRYDRTGVARHGYAAEAAFIDTPQQARYHYAKRFGIEASYRLGEATTASTTTQNPAVRLVFVVVSLLLQNTWRYLHWDYVSRRRRGGRRLRHWPFDEFVDMVTRAVWKRIDVRRSVPSNRPPDDRFGR